MLHTEKGNFRVPKLGPGSEMNRYEQEVTRSRSVVNDVNRTNGFAANEYLRGKIGYKSRHTSNKAHFVKYEPDRIQSIKEKVAHYMKILDEQDDSMILSNNDKQLLKNI